MGFFQLLCFSSVMELTKPKFWYMGVIACYGVFGCVKGENAAQVTLRGCIV